MKSAIGTNTVLSKSMITEGDVDVVLWGSWDNGNNLDEPVGCNFADGKYY